MSSLITSRALPLPLFYAYMAGTCVGKARQLMSYARQAQLPEWKCRWVKEARQSQREARDWMRRAKEAQS